VKSGRLQRWLVRSQLGGVGSKHSACACSAGRIPLGLPWMPGITRRRAGVALSRTIGVKSTDNVRPNPETRQSEIVWEPLAGRRVCPIGDPPDSDRPLTQAEIDAMTDGWDLGPKIM
jgi:hypothetical protein